MTDSTCESERETHPLTFSSIWDTTDWELDTNLTLFDHCIKMNVHTAQKFSLCISILLVTIISYISYTRHKDLENQILAYDVLFKYSGSTNQLHADYGESEVLADYLKELAYESSDKYHDNYHEIHVGLQIIDKQHLEWLAKWCVNVLDKRVQDVDILKHFLKKILQNIESETTLHWISSHKNAHVRDTHVLFAGERAYRRSREDVVKIDVYGKELVDHFQDVNDLVKARALYYYAVANLKIDEEYLNQMIDPSVKRSDEAEVLNLLTLRVIHGVEEENAESIKNYVDILIKNSNNDTILEQADFILRLYKQKKM